jgi:ribonuclease P protein component
VGNAVVRNRLRRLVREGFRRRRGDLPPALDLVVIPYRKAAQSESAAVLENLDKLTQSILTEWERGR